MSYVPERGDIVWLDFDPSAGIEQIERRPALVLTPKAFNRQLHLALVAPITSRIRGHGFEVLLEGTKTEGAVLCQQVRIVDYGIREMALIEIAPACVVNKALARVRAMVS